MYDATIVESIGIFFAAVVAGTFGALLGLGGGIIVIPVLTMIFKVPIKEAIAASLVSVIATSTSAAIVYVEKHFVNIRLGMTLELATTIGALLAGFTVVYINSRALALLFSAILIYTALNMLRKKEGGGSLDGDTYIEVPPQATRRELEAHISDGRTPYKITRMPLGMAASFVAGTLSGLLGIGGGIIKVPVMQLFMGVPMRVAIATSNFMIGVTAAASALIYYSRGYINPLITVPSALGVLLGAQIGVKLVHKVKVRVLTQVFVVVLIFTAIQMIVRAI